MAAIAAAPGLGEGWATSDVLLRLRLARAEYDASERLHVNSDARLHRVPGRQAALITARDARRSCLAGLPEDAQEGWRDAINNAIHAGLSDDAAHWLYAVRWLNVQYGPWTFGLDEEHRLAQALRSTGAGRLLERGREPGDAARAALVGGHPIDAVLSARQWLVDSVITGSWANEQDALQLLAQLYRNNAEPVLAASLYERAGQAKELTAMAAEVGDLKLPIAMSEDAPWWVVRCRGAVASAQRDLLGDAEASELLAHFTDTANRGRHGELVDSPQHALTHQAVQTACELADRGSPEQALALLDLLAADVPREPNHYRQSDAHHAKACLAIALAPIFTPGG